MKTRTAIMWASLAAATFLISNVTAFAAVIDFENLNLGGQQFLDVDSPLQFNNVGGSGVNVTIVGGADLRIYDLFQFGNDPAATGQALIDWPWPIGTNAVGTTILFDTALSQFSLRAGDFRGDSDSPLMIIAFDAANNVIGTSSASWSDGQNPPFAVLSINAIGIRKVVYSSGGSFAGSTFIDDLTFTPVPEPCPCDAPWRNHGEYVRCVKNMVAVMQKEGLLTKAQGRRLIMEAAKSDCGHKRSKKH